MTDQRIFLSSPDVTSVEEAALLRAFRSGWIAPLGPEVDAFEKEIAARCGRRHAVALSSGTAALHLALLELGVRPTDAVLVSTMTFVATANAVRYVQATPVFVDTDEHGLMNPGLLERAISEARARGQRVGAIIPVDLLGKVADYGTITEIAARYHIPVLSDAAESLGAVRYHRPAGSFGEVAAVSFNGNKIMTTSGGGALLTDDEAIATRARYLATQARQPTVHYEHTEIGFNYRMSNLLAALGRAQLGRLDTMIELRRQHRVTYAEMFQDVPGVYIFGAPDGSSPEHAAGLRDNFWLTAILVDPDEAHWEAEDLRLALADRNIEARPLWKPMHAQPVFDRNPRVLDGTSDLLFARGLSLPSGSALRDEEMDRIRTCVADFLGSRVPV